MTGLLVWLPVGVTVWVLLWMLGAMDGLFRWLLSATEALLPAVRPAAEQLRHIPGLGLVLLIVVLLLTGVLVTNMVGQWFLGQWNRLVTRIPIVRNIYSGVQQISDTLFSKQGQAFSRAVLIEYPRRGAWTVAFLTGQAKGEIQDLLDADWLSVYVPTTPNPTSGYFLLLPQTDVVYLDMSVEEALKYVISMGVLAPGKKPEAAPAKTLDN